jgi:hypothetical protein
MRLMPILAASTLLASLAAARAEPACRDCSWNVVNCNGACSGYSYDKATCTDGAYRTCAPQVSYCRVDSGGQVTQYCESTCTAYGDCQGQARVQQTQNGALLASWLGPRPHDGRVVCIEATAAD